MARALRGSDKALVVFGVVIFLCAVTLLSLTGILNSSRSLHTNYYVYSVHYGIGGWTLLIAVVSIASGALEHQGLYAAVIVLTIFGILAISAGLAVALIGFFFGGLWGAVLQLGFPTEGIPGAHSLAIGLVAVDGLTLVTLLITSCVACCGSCHSSVAPAVNTDTADHGGPGMALQAAPGYTHRPPDRGYNYPHTTVRGVRG